MTYQVEITTKTKIGLDIEIVAKWFCALSDEQQADFFIAVANEAQSWELSQGDQWWFVGRHLRNCTCSTDEAREMVKNLHSGLCAPPFPSAQRSNETA